MSQPALLPYDPSALKLLLPFFSVVCLLHTSEANMASGVEVSDNVKNLYDMMKLVKSDADQNDRIRLAVLDIVNDKIEVAQTYTEKELVCDGIFKKFKEQLKKKECHYILYDCHYENDEASKKEELIFVTWCDEEASIKIKMSYASSKHALNKILSSVKHNWQFNDLSDCGDEGCFAAKLGCVASLEGCPLKQSKLL